MITRDQAQARTAKNIEAREAAKSAQEQQDFLRVFLAVERALTSEYDGSELRVSLKHLNHPLHKISYETIKRVAKAYRIAGWKAWHGWDSQNGGMVINIR